MPENSPILVQGKEIPTKETKSSPIPVNSVNSAIQENIRAIILLLLDKGYTKAEIGRKSGFSGNYISMILNYKYFPTKAEDQIKLFKKFDEMLNQIKKEQEQNGSQPNF